MNKLAVNREYFVRHAFVALLMAGLGCWFGYDGFAGYPNSDPAALYESIEGAPPQEGTDLEAFKRQKIQSQIGFMSLCFVASVWIVLGLLASARFRFEWDENGFVAGGRRFSYGDIVSADRSQWAKKQILFLRLGKQVVKLDAWHHRGVKEFEELLGKIENGKTRWEKIP